MKGKRFNVRFFILALIILAFGYTAGIIFEQKKIHNQYNVLYSKAKQMGDRTLEILFNQKLNDKIIALKFIYQNFLDQEPAFAFYQIGKMKRNMFYPILGNKREGTHIVNLSLNELTTQTGQVINGFINKDSFLIYQQDMLLNKIYYGKLFIAFNKYKLSQVDNNTYTNIFAFLVIMIIIGFLIFKRFFYKTKQLQQLYDPYISESEHYYPPLEKQFDILPLREDKK